MTVVILDVASSIPGELNIYAPPEIIKYSQGGFFGPNRHVWFNFTIRDNDTLNDITQIKVVAYHRQYSSLSASDSREYHYTFTWTWTNGWQEQTYTEHLGYSSSPTDPTAYTGNWSLEITCDEKCIPGLWAIYLEAIDQKQGKSTLTVNVEGYGPYEVTIKSVLATIVGTLISVKTYIEVKNNNQKYAPDVTLVTKITDSSGTLLTEKNTTINVPAEYSKLIEVKLSFTGSQQQYILTAFVVDPHNISSPEDTATFTPSIPTAPAPAVPFPPSPPSPPTVPTPSWFWYLVAALSIIIVLVLAIYALMRMSKGKSIKLSDTW